jgi:hypothetical protein
VSDSIRPFHIEIPEAQLSELRDRLRRTRWPEAETVDDWSQVSLFPICKSSVAIGVRNRLA